jgi:hypothetical protein
LSRQLNCNRNPQRMKMRLSQLLTLMIVPIAVSPSASADQSGHPKGASHNCVLRYYEGMGGVMDCTRDERIPIRGKAPPDPVYGGGHYFSGGGHQGHSEPGSPSPAPDPDRKRKRREKPKPKPDLCAECEVSLGTCIAGASRAPVALYTAYEADSDDACNLNKPGRPPGDAIARGGNRIDDLIAEKVKIPGFSPRDWSYGCHDDDGTGEIFCSGPAFASCKRSYRQDNPLADIGQDSIRKFTIPQTEIGGSQSQSVSYRYGAHSGHYSAMQEVRAKLRDRCAEHYVSCVEQNCK